MKNLNKTKKTKRKLTTTILIIVLIVIFAAAVYFLFMKKDSYNGTFVFENVKVGAEDIGYLC